MKRLLIAIGIAAMSAGCTKAQEATPPPGPEQPKPKTKLEAFQAQVGSVIIRGFSEIGAITGQYGTSVSIESREFTNATTGTKQYGVAIEVNGGGRLELKNTSYIDYDEIDSLIRGIDYISKIKSDVTRMNDFQADYRTKGDFRVSTYSTTGGTIAAAAASGTIGGAQALLTLSDLGKLRDLLLSAKQTIDSAKTAK